MRTSVVATAFVFAALYTTRAHGQSRVSVEVGGIVSAYDVQSAPGAGVSRGAITVPNPPGGTGGNAASAGGGPAAASSGIAAFEVRPTVTLEGGFLMGVGFRVGQAGLGDVNSSLVGADIALGFQHKFGPFMPFLRGIFGINSYDIPNTLTGHQTDLRLDAELGSRLYLSRRMFVSAAAFAGWGDRYGATVSVGGDVVQIFHRGVMP
ncbi:MAG TPA: hypothetical protein VF334_12410 [Polyangia bacterium]